MTPLRPSGISRGEFSKREKRESQNTSIFLVLLYDAGLIPGKQNYHVSSVLNTLVIV